jgi:carbonic anhydrase
MKKTLTHIALVVSLCLAIPALAGEKSAITADQAIKKLQDGNQRYVQAKFQNAGKAAKRRAEVAKGQKPFAVVVGCSDSRVPPEVIFDQGLGDLFIIRLAGNIVDDAALGSIEYAVDHLGAPLIVVLGHERCGAVTAAVQGGEAHGHLPALVKAIQPAVDKVKGKPGDTVDNAIRANVAYVSGQIRTSEPILAPAAKAGKVKVMGAYYDLDDGKVTFTP